MRTTPLQRQAIELICQHPDSSVCTIDQTWADAYTTYVHWRTARALEKRELVAIDEDGQILPKQAIWWMRRD